MIISGMVNLPVLLGIYKNVGQVIPYYTPQRRNTIPVQNSKLKINNNNNNNNNLIFKYSTIQYNFI